MSNNTLFVITNFMVLVAMAAIVIFAPGYWKLLSLACLTMGLTIESRQKESQNKQSKGIDIL